MASIDYDRMAIVGGAGGGLGDCHDGSNCSVGRFDGGNKRARKYRGCCGAGVKREGER